MFANDKKEPEMTHSDPLLPLHFGHLACRNDVWAVVLYIEPLDLGDSRSGDKSISTFFVGLV